MKRMQHSRDFKNEDVIIGQWNVHWDSRTTEQHICCQKLFNCRRSAEHQKLRENWTFGKVENGKQRGRDTILSTKKEKEAKTSQTKQHEQWKTKLWLFIIKHSLSFIFHLINPELSFHKLYKDNKLHKDNQTLVFVISSFSWQRQTWRDSFWSFRWIYTKGEAFTHHIQTINTLNTK